MNLDELYENLSIEINNLGIRLDKNIYKGECKEVLGAFLKDFYSLCENKKFNVLFSDLEALGTYQMLRESTEETTADYVIGSVKRFYTEFRESIKDELY